MRGLVKRGLSDVVTTVLLIALTIIVISIVWIGVMPMIRDRIGSGDSCMSADVSIETTQGYTCWDSVQNVSIVQVRVGNVNVNVSGFKFLLSSNGNTLYYPKESYALPNSYNMFFLNTTGLSSIDRVGVAAVVRSAKTTKDCTAMFVDKIKTCNAGTVNPAQILNPTVQK